MIILSTEKVIEFNLFNYFICYDEGCCIIMAASMYYQGSYIYYKGDYHCYYKGDYTLRFNLV